MSLSKKDLTRLGFGGVLGANKEASFVDDNKISHKKMRDINIDIINKGTLRKQDPVLIIRENIDNQRTWKTDMITDLLDKEDKNFYSEYTLEQIPFGQISFFNSDKLYYGFNNNDFFAPFTEFKQPNMNFGSDNDFQYVRLSYPIAQNATSIIGKRNTREGLQDVIYNGATVTFPGIKTIRKNRQFKTWISSNTENYNAENYTNFYIPYPTTLQNYNYNAYNCDIKIAPFLNQLSSFAQDMNGLLIISTGNNISQKICYISPHGLSTGYRNTIVYISGYSKNPSTNLVGQRKIATGILAPCLLIGSEYYSGDIFPTTGVTYNGDIPSGEYSKDSVTGISGFVNNMKLDQDQCLFQSTPIQDTLYYKFYNSIYTGIKDFNTGTWSGIIPSGTPFSIELVSVELNKEIGTKNQFYILYSGFGTNDTIDALITKYLTRNNIESGNFIGTNIYVGEEKTYKGTGRNIDPNPQKSLINAIIDSRYIILTKISNLIKKYVPQIIKENRKLRKLRAYLNR